MINDLITTYCIRYDPQLCVCDPELLWYLIRSQGGSVHAIPCGQLDFYVPSHIVSIFLLSDSGLRVRTQDSYI
jgi:hypothetical protein